ncbi:MAG: YkgJ family cysteine cluster protein [Clostridia bacterium]|nr:YkgJ family cysteine cluster protein [Clostridia bacterium]
MKLSGKISLLPYVKNGHTGIDIQIVSPDAVVSDYLEALDGYILQGGFTRLRAETSQCEGCVTCCGERMPLTSIDAFMLQKALAPDLSLGQFLNRYAYVAVSGRMVDILLSRAADEQCLFLDRKDLRCAGYRDRPLVCRTYICAPLSPRAQKLRQEITNTGEDELVRLWVQGYLQGENQIHEAADPEVRPEDWSKSAWTGKTAYREVLLREILSPKLLADLMKDEGMRIV